MDSLPAVARSGRICDALPPRPTQTPQDQPPVQALRPSGRESGPGRKRRRVGTGAAPALPARAYRPKRGRERGRGSRKEAGAGRGSGGVTQQLQSSPAAARREQAKDRISERMFHVKHPFHSVPYFRTSTPSLSEKAASPSRVRLQTAPKKLRALPARAYPGLGDQRSIILPIRSLTRSEPVVGFLRPRVSNSRKRPVRNKHLAIQTPEIAP